MARTPEDEGLHYDGRRVVDLSPEEEDWDQEASGPPKTGTGKAILLLLVAVVLVGAGMGAGWLIYSNQAGVAGGGAPLVRAPSEPAKVRPKDPGGMEVPDTDKGVYDVVSGNAAEPRTEKLLDAPERPQLPVEVEADAKSDADDSGQPLKITRPEPAPPAEPVAAPPPLAPATPEVVEEPAPAPSPKATGTATAPPPTPAVAAPKPDPAPAPKKPIQLTKSEPAPSAPAETATAVAPTSGSWRIQVGALRDEAAARAEFSRLQRRHPDLLGNLGLSIMKFESSTKGTFYRMRAGPLNNSDAASSLCDRLKAQKVPCLTVRPGS